MAPDNDLRNDIMCATLVDSRRAARLTLALALAWLVFLVFPLISVVASYRQWADGARWLAPAVGLALTGAVYGWAVMRAVGSPKRPVGWPNQPTLVALAMLSALALALPLAFGAAWFGGLLYPSLLAGLLLTPRRMAPVIVVFAALTIVVGGVVGVVWWETVSLTLLTGLGGAIMSGATWLRATNAKLREAQTEIARLTANRERSQFARDLHDTVKQHVFVTAMEIGAARALVGRDADALATHLDRANASVRQAQAELAGLIRQPDVSPLAGRSLAAALRDYLSDWSSRTGIHTEAQISATIRPMLAPVADALYRVAQEALANTARHSRATTAGVTLSEHDGTLTLCAWDNGDGFVLDAAASAGEAGGDGLRNMRERVATINGRLTIESGTRQGTRVTVAYTSLARAEATPPTPRRRWRRRTSPTALASEPMGQ